MADRLSHSRSLAHGVNLAVVLAAVASPATAADTPWARVGQSGRLVYGMDAFGDRIGDFSTVGYKGGGVALPDYTQAISTPDRLITLSPVAGDNRTAIQNAINAIAAKPLDANGFRGVVQLNAGTFNIASGVSITASGIILRGAGNGSNPATSTILAYTGTSQINMVSVDSSSSRQTVANTTHNIVDKAVPAGATSFTVDSLTNWAVGDKIVIQRPSNATWIHDIGMDAIPPASDGSTVQWTPGSKDQLYERVITYIDPAKKRVMLDAPIPNAMTQEYGGGRVYKYTFNRTTNVGIENLRGNGQAVLTTPTDEAHANSFIVMQDTGDAWVRNVTGQRLVYATVEVGTGSRNVTVDGAASVEPISQITGGRRYPFNIEGQLSLMKNLSSDNGRHDFVNNSSSRGPNVFLDGVATNSHADSGPHQRWSTGTLYDNITTNTSLNVQDRGNSGTGHGWAGAQMVVWNSKAGSFKLQNPQDGSQNWLIGATGTVSSPSPRDPAYVSSQGSKVLLNGETSLYRAQLADRLAHAGEQRREYVVGDYDGFAADGASDLVELDPQWKAAVQGLSANPVAGFDSLSTNANVPFTFSFALQPGEQVTSAVLTLAVRTIGDPLFAANDRIYIEGTDTFVDFRSLGVLPKFGDSEIVQLEFLSSDPETPLSFLQDGKLNLLVADDHAVDWANLQFTVAPGGAPVPEPVGGGLLAIVGLVRWRASRSRRVNKG